LNAQNGRSVGVAVRGRTQGSPLQPEKEFLAARETSFSAAEKKNPPVSSEETIEKLKALTSFKLPLAIEPRPARGRRTLSMSIRTRFLVPVLGGALWLGSFSHPVRAQIPAPSPSLGGPIRVLVDGRAVNFADSPPQSVGGRLLVPLRAIFEALGATVDFSNGLVRARRGETTLQLQIGSNQASVNGANRTLDVPAQAIFGRTFVPLRFVGEALGAGVSFDTATQTVSISSPDGGTGTNSAPIYQAPQAAPSVTGTLLRVSVGEPSSLSLVVNGAIRNFQVGEGALILRQNSVASSPTATPVRQPPRGVALSSLVPGETVRVVLDGANANRVSKVTAQSTIVIARVQYGAGNQIILDDANDTTLTLGPNLIYTDPTGRTASTVSLNAGQSVALFLSPQNRTITRVSSDPRDLVVQAGGTSDPLPAGSLPPANAPTIGLVQTDATAPLKAGDKLAVSARATTGQRLTWSLGAKIQNQPLLEDPNEAGVYRTTYTIRKGDDVLNARVSVRLLGADQFEAAAQSEKPVTIDTVAPRLIGTFPANGATIRVAQPNIAIFADDLNGSGLSSATVSVTSNGTTTPIPTTLAPPTSVNAVPPLPLSGRVQVKAIVTDRAGNSLPVSFAFTISPNAGAGAIASFTQGATRDLAPGEDVPLQLAAAPAGRAFFDVLDARGTSVAHDLPMSEDADTPGTYKATYRVPDDATGQLRFVGKFDAGDGVVSQQEATAPVALVAATAATNLTITAPTDGATGIGNSLVVSGRAAPGATVSVSVTASGTRYFVVQYNNDLGTVQARADAKGDWKTAPIPVPRPKNVQGLTLAISATQTDGANRTSDPVTISVSP